jgi:hypothetical protein
MDRSRSFTFAGSLCLCLLLLTFLSSPSIAQSTAFNYQGRLTDNSVAANGSYEMKFTLHDAASDGNQVGSAVTLTNVQVTNGVFTVQLDFGNEFPGTGRWLEISVKKPADASFTALSPRQEITSTPYAIRSLNAANVEASSAGNSVINAINDPATNVVIAESRLPSDLVRIKPGSAQTAPTAGDSDALINITGSSVSFPSVFKYNNDGAFAMIGTSDLGASSSGVPVEGTGTRVLWHPRKAAFRAGSLNTNYTGVDDPLPIYSSGTQWDEANIGNFSVAMGENVRANGDFSVAMGKNATASQNGAFAIGDYVIASGASSVAMGYHANTNARPGSFVIADRSSVDILRAGVNHSANWRVSGGFRIFTSSNLSTGVTIQSGASVSNWGQSSAVISTSTGAMLTTGGVWQNASSRDLKDNFKTVDTRNILQKVLDLPIQTWNYKSEGVNFRHIGPVSQDFFTSFGLGTDEKSIGTVDADGVALAAIQGLNEKLEKRTADLQKENELLKQQLNSQQAAIEALKKLICASNPDADICK